MSSRSSISKKGRNPLGRMGPWSWLLEPVRGCNLKCGYCATRLFFDEPKQMISDDIWSATFKLIRLVSPYTRVEIANAGEPTLHPHLSGLLKMARSLSPFSQLQITTNGTRLIKGAMTYGELFDAGANILYVDMYARKDKHEELARKSGFPWYYYYDKPKGAPGAWTYAGPHLKLIVLMDPPERWPKNKQRQLNTFLNNLDWPAASRIGLKPVMEPPARMCPQPFRHVVLNVHGQYRMCCYDFMDETAGKLGSVDEGLEGFRSFWFGEYMQRLRGALHHKDRTWNSQCLRCSCISSRNDFHGWPDAVLKQYWHGGAWQPLKDDAHA